MTPPSSVDGREALTEEDSVSSLSDAELGAEVGAAPLTPLTPADSEMSQGPDASWDAPYGSVSHQLWDTMNHLVVVQEPDEPGEGAAPGPEQATLLVEPALPARPPEPEPEPLPPTTGLPVFWDALHEYLVEFVSEPAVAVQPAAVDGLARRPVFDVTRREIGWIHLPGSGLRHAPAPASAPAAAAAAADHRTRVARRARQVDSTYKTSSRTGPCELCGKAFSRLDKHMMVHLKTKPHQCPVCKIAFTQSEHLRRHQQRHEQTRDPKRCFQCPECPKLLSRKDKLKDHLKNNHNVIMPGPE